MPQTSAGVHGNAEIPVGTPVVVGARVPVEILFEYVKAGDSLHAFPGPVPLGAV